MFLKISMCLVLTALKILSPTEAWISFPTSSQPVCTTDRRNIKRNQCNPDAPLGEKKQLHSRSLRRPLHTILFSTTPQSKSSSTTGPETSPSLTRNAASPQRKDRLASTSRRLRSVNNHRDFEGRQHGSNAISPQHQQNIEKRRQNSIRYLFRTAKTMERQGRWGEALTLLQRILQKDPNDSHSHLALARLEARREGKVLNHSRDTYVQQKHQEEQSDSPSRAQRAFETGTTACPESVHLWQGWAIYEQSRGNLDRARELFEEALTLDPFNPYVCHAYGLMEKKLCNDDRAVQLIERALYAENANVTAALVCSLGEWLIASDKLQEARDLYQAQLPHLTTEKDQVEIYLALAWLEERHFQQLDRAKELLERALTVSPTSSLASVALARLEGRMYATEVPNSQNQVGSPGARCTNMSVATTKATAQRLASICDELHKKGTENKENSASKLNRKGRSVGEKSIPNSAEDGRVFNALATLEIKQQKFKAARDVLRKGIELYPFDHNLLTAAGKVEEHLRNYTAARQFYSESLRLEPSAPTLVAYALLELNYPAVAELLPSTSSNNTQANFTLVKGLFEEALLLDPRNGPAYNAYGNAEARRGNIEEARSIFERGVQANCSDVASIYHGYGMLELSLGNVEEAREILQQGLESVRQSQDMILSDIPRRDRARFLSHTLGMLELNSNRPAVALEIFQEGIERCGNTSRLLLGAALSEMRLGKEEAARKLFERSILADKRHAEAWQAWGVMETRAGHFNRASIIFQNGIKNAPKHASLWHGYASLELKRGNVMNARTLFAAGIKKATRRQFALFQGWAMLELREGNYQAARKLISEALTQNKKNGRGWMIAAQIEEQDGNHSGLVSLLLRRGIECDPNDAELYRELGEYLVGQGKINDAREVFEKGMEVNPMYAPLYHSMAELEARICNLDGLAKLNKRAAELFNQNALEPAPLSTKVLGTKIKAKYTSFDKRSNSDKPISAFATRIVDDDVQGETLLGFVGSGVDAFSMLESLNGNGLVDDMMSVESIDQND
ncbi:type IV pilus biogenesis/stability protein PilW [Nitzschia inconspicua]|uniref:Type IV pilus biogenesis/stability protein PilW n=1 Tax=Nitzschia inconspicua TaxID=303405 RepID=A0A9K3L350_9STRA|nr:type IV pilus biogenesis/stability protein PilW [Nitzschia inconspicua]